MARATVDGLRSLRRPEDVARIRGKAIRDVLPLPAQRPAAEEPQPAPPAAAAAAEPAEESES
jgi:hypothetical protein